MADPLPRRVGRAVGGVSASVGRVFSPVNRGSPKIGLGGRGPNISVGLGRRSPREVLVLILGDELVVGQPALVQLGALLADLRRRPLLRGLLLGDPGLALGDLGPLGQLFGRLAVLGSCGLAPLTQLALTRPQARPLTQAGQRHRERDQEQGDYHYYDDQTC